MTHAPNDFESHYDEFYAREDVAEWRAAGALDKADNIVRTWGRTVGTPRPSCVDIGCGDGAVDAALSARGFFGELRGFDVSSSGVSQANARGLAGATFEVTDGRLPLEDRRADLAILSHVVEHVEDPRAILREAARVADYVFVEVPMEHYLRASRDFEWTDTGHINFYDRVLIRKLIQSCGMTVVDELIQNPGLPWARRTGDKRALRRWQVKNAALRLAPAVAPHLVSYHVAVLARSNPVSPAAQSLG